MQITAALLFGISASLDALLIGITFGLRGIRISLRQNSIISIITLLGTGFAVLLGSGLTAIFPALLWNILGSVILFLFGLYYLFKCFSAACSKEGDCHSVQTLSWKESCLLGCSLSANNIGIGLSVGATGLTLIPVIIATLLFSFTFLALGNSLGTHRRFHFSPFAADIITGILLIFLGLLQLLDALL